MISKLRKFFKKRLVSDNLYVLSSNLLLQVKGLLIIPFLIKIFGAHFYGSYSIVLIVTSFIYGISSFGIGFKFTRFFPVEVELNKKHKLFYDQFWVHLFFLAAVIIVIDSTYPFLLRKILKVDEPYLVYAISLFLISNFFFSKGVDYFRYSHRLNIFSYLIIANTYGHLFLILIIWLFKLPFSISILLFSNAFVLIILGAGLLIKIKSEMGIVFTIPNFLEFRSDFILGFPIILVYIVEFFLASSDRVILSHYFGNSVLAYYNPAYTLGSLLIFLPKVFSVAIQPYIALNEHRASEKSNKIILIAMSGFVGLSIIYFLFAALWGTNVLMILTNPEIASKSHRVYMIIIIANIFFGLSMILSNTVLYLKLATKVIFYSNILSVVLNISLNIALISLLRDFQIAAYTTLLAYFISFIFITIYILRNYPELFRSKANDTIV